MVETIKECNNCNLQFEGNYCNNCGQKAGETRFTLLNLPEEFLHGFFHVHNGLIFTIKELFIRPGAMLRGYLSGKRVTYFNPFTYLVLISLLGGFMFSNSGWIDHTRDNFLASPATVVFTHKHFSYRMLLTIPAIAVMCWILFRSSAYNLGEQLIISTFLTSQSVFFMSVWFLIIYIVNPDDSLFEFFFSCAFISAILYQVIALYHLFNNGNKTLRIIKASVSVISGLSLSFVLMNFIANQLNSL
jgi:hypothetical protein